MLKYIWPCASMAIFWIAIATATVGVPDAIPQLFAAALIDARRPADEVRLDGARKPAELLAFAGVKAGDTVADFMPGNGYFTRILSDVVGANGHVYAFVPAEQAKNCAPREIAGIRALARRSDYSNVAVSFDTLRNFRMPHNLDVLWTAQNYHDLHDSFMGPADIAALSRAFFDALKPGGVLVVVDHVAEAGSGLRDTETLHRIDPAVIRAEVEAAGFILEASSDVLRNPDDDHRRSVFDAAIRGRTDQIAMRFRKPALEPQP